MSNKLDIVILGASGYTGKFVVRELANMSKSKKFTWGLAARSIEEIEQLAKSVAKETSDTEISSDIKNELE